MSTRTFLSQEIRPYKIDVYGLQDNYIGTLQSYNDNFIGQTTEPQIVVSKDGTQSFTCSIPKYYIDPITNEKIINPRWEDTKNGVLAENTRILKAFVNFKDETKVFPFIVDEIKDKRDSHFSTFKEIKANGLAFAELGKIGYKIELNQALFESNELEENPEAIMTIQYWLDQVFPNEKDENGNIIKWFTPWCYEIRMDWSQYPTESRLATKVYDDRFINSWAIDDNTNELIANGIQVSREKSRAIDCKNSNKYNITQDIAKAFEVFCDYEYKTAANGQFIKEYTDENGLIWTGRKVIFYNSAINIDNPLYLNYQKNLQTIERTAESSELYTKLFVTPSESSIMKSGYVTIADTFANPTLDDFILNFDYLYSIGSISDYQMQFAKNYEVEVRRINSHLMAKSPVIDDLVVEMNDRKAEIAGYDKQIASAREQYTYYEKLKNNQVTNTLVVKNEANPYSTIFVPEGTVYRAALKLEGIIASSIKGYINKYSEPLFKNADLKLIKSVDEIDDSKNYFLLLDEHDFPSAIYSIITPSDVVLYLDLEYSPRNKYENICASFLNEIDNYEKQKITVEEIVVGLESQLEKVQKEYNDKLKEKEELNQKLERIMGPALREGYWTPDRYDDVGQAHIKECSFNNGIEFTTSLFENEQLSYVDIGKDRIYYPYINIDNQLKSKWIGHDLNNLILHLQRDFTFTATEQATLDVGNYYFLYNSRQYYFKLDNKLVAGDSLTIKIEGATINLILNNSSPIELVSFLEDATNVTQRFEDSTVTLGDYLLYNNAGFIFSFKHNENNELTPILLLNNDKLFSEYRKYNRLAYSFQGETVVTLIEGIIQDYPDIAYSIYFPRILLAEDNVIYTSDTLTITIGKDENAIELKKYYDYSILLHEGKTCITLKPTGNNPFYNLVDASIIYNVNYRVSQANEALYIDAKQVAKDNSKPKFSYDVSVALISSWEDNQIEKMPLIELGQLAYISDPILGVHAVTGYVSEITYKLDKPQEDEIKIQNYKTKFEDLFETITASSEAMKNNQVAYDIAAGNFGPDGTISGDVIQTAINNNDFFFNYSATGIDINPTEGIILTNKKPYANGVYGQIVLQGGGIFLSDSITNTGERIWNNGITPKGINASLITSGQINTNVIKVFAGDDMAFQWNSEGIYAYKSDESGRLNPNIFVQYSQSGLHLTDDTLEAWDEADKVRNHQSLVTLDWNGLALRNHSGQKTLTADLDGNLIIRGTLKSYDYREGESRLLSTGWKIEPTGYAEFNDLFVRGTISASVFEYEETSAVGGRLLVSPTFILKSEHTNKANIQMAADAPLKIIVPIGVSIENNSFVAGGRTWKLNDVVIFNGKFINKNAFPLIKLGKNINDYPIYETKQLYMVISNLNPTNNTITLASIAEVDGLTQNLFYGADGNIVDANSAIIAMGGLGNIAGTGDWHLISFGTNGAKEGILLTAIEPNSGSYIDILGKGKDDLTGSTRVRLGDLSDLAANQELIEALGVAPQGWGLYADNAYLRGAIYATSGKIGGLTVEEVEETKLDLQNVTERLANAELLIKPDAIISTVTSSQIYKDNLDSKADQDDLNSLENAVLRIDQAVQEITPEYIINSVTKSETYLGDLNSKASSQDLGALASRVTKAEEKITDEAIINTVTKSETYLSDLGSKTDNSEFNSYKVITSSQITQTAQAITSEVSRATAAEMELNSKITQTADSIRSEVSDLSSDVGEVKTAVQEITPNYIVNTVTSSTTYKQDLGTKANINDVTALATRVSSAEQKITAEAIINTVTSSTTYKQDLGAKADASDLADLDDRIDEVNEAVLKITPEAIISAVTNSVTYKNDMAGKANINDVTALETRISSAEQKITADAIVNTVTSSTTYKQDLGAKANTSDLTDLDNRIEEVNEAVLKITPEVIISTVTNSATYKQDLGAKADASTVSSQITQTARAIRSEVSIANKDLQSQITQNANNINLTVRKDGIISAINLSSEEASIKADKIKLEGLVTANNYFKINTDGSIAASSGTIGGWTIGETSLHSGSSNNYVALSSDSNSDYRIWAGGEEPKGASFAVTKTGEVYLNKVYVQTGYDEETQKYTYSTQSLSDYPLWAIWGNYSNRVTGFTAEQATDGTVTLTITRQSAEALTVNFKKAADGELWAVGGGVGAPSFTVYYGERSPDNILTSMPFTLQVNGANGADYTDAYVTASTYGHLNIGYVYTAGYTNATINEVREAGQELVDGNIPLTLVQKDGTVLTGFSVSGQTAVEVGATEAIKNASLTLVVNEGGKIATGTISTVGTNETKIIADIDVSDAYEAGANSVSVDKVEVYDDASRSGNYIHIPTKVTLKNSTSTWMSLVSADCSSIFKEIEDSVTVDTVVITGNTWTQGEYAYANVTATASNKKYKTQQISIHAKDIYDAGVTYGANSLKILPVEDESIKYGESVVITATTINGAGDEVKKSTSITIPPDRYNEARTIPITYNWSAGQLSITKANMYNYITLTPASRAVSLTQGAGTWNNNKYTFSIMDAGRGSTGLTCKVDASDVHKAGVTTGANSLTISPTEDKILGYGKPVTITATTINGAGTKVTKSVTITAPPNNFNDGASSVTLSAAGWQGGSNVVSASNGKSVTVDLPSFSTSGGTTWVGNKTTVYFSTPSVSGPLKSVTVDASDVHKAGVTYGANSLAIEPAEDKILGYGKPVTITATTINGAGTKVEKKVTITAPPDNFSAGYNDHKTKSGVWATGSSAGTSFTIHKGITSTMVSEASKNGSLNIITSGTNKVAQVIIGNATVAQASLNGIYASGVTYGANSLTISPAEGDTLKYGKSVTITATTINGSGTAVTKSVTFKAPEDNFSAGANSITVDSIKASGPVYGEKTVSVNMEATLSDGRKAIFSSSNIDCTKIYQNGENSVTIPNENIVRQAGDAYAGGSDYSTTVYIRATASNGKYGTQSFTVSGKSAYNSGKNDGANSLAISPSTDETLAYGASKTIVATTTKADGTTITKSVKITAPTDRYEEGETNGILAVRNNSVLSIEGIGVTAKVVAKYSGSKYNEISLQSFYSGGVTTGATSAINNASLSLVVSDDGKTATGTISTNGVDTKKTISGIDVSKAYKVGEDSVTVPNANIVRQAADVYTGGSNYATTVYIKASASNGAYGTQSFSVSGKTAYDQGKNAGANSLTISPAKDETLDYAKSRTITATTTKADGTTITKSVTITAPKNNFNDGRDSVTLSAAGWQGGTYTVRASNGKTHDVAHPKVSLSGGTTWGSNNTTTVYASSDAVTGNLAYRVVDASSVYDSGVADGKDLVTLTEGEWSSNKKIITASNGKTVTVDASSIYTSGQNNGMLLYRPSNVSVSGTISGDHEYALSVITKNVYGNTILTFSNIEFDARDAYDNGYDDGESSVTLTAGEWSSNKKTVTASNGQSVEIDATEIYSSGYTVGWNNVLVPNRNIVRQAADYYAGGADYATTVYVKATASNNAYGTQSFTVSGKNAYNAGLSTGEKSVTLSEGEWSDNKMIVTASNGKTLTVDASDIYSEAESAGFASGFNVGKGSVTLTSSGWTNGSNIVSASNGQSVTVSHPTVTLSGGTSWNTSYKTTVYASSNAISGYLTSKVVDASSVYTKGVTDGESNVTLTVGDWSNNKKIVTASNGKSIEVDASAIYEAGADDVTITSLARDGETSQSGKVCSFYVKATASNGQTKTQLFSTTCDKIYQNGWNACKPTSVTGGTPSYQGSNQYTVALTAKNSAGTVVGTGTCSVDARDAYGDGRNTEAGTLTISSSTTSVSPLDYGKSVTVTATTANNTTGKSVTITAPPDRYSEGYGFGYTKGQTDGKAEGQATEARSLSISPSSAKTLDYGESVTVTATTTNNSTGKSVTITAPEMPDIQISGGSTWQTSCQFYITCGDKTRTITVRASTINPSGSPTGYIGVISGYSLD